MRRFPLLAAPMVAAAAAFLTGRPAAAGLPALAVHRTEDTSGCPDAPTLAALVAAQMKRPALEPAVEGQTAHGQGLDVQMYRSEAGFTAVMQAGGKTRQLSDTGATCEGLAAALAISIAVLLDTEPLPPSRDPEPPAPPPVATPPEPTPLVAPPELSPLPPSEGRRFRVLLAGGPVVTAGVLRPFTPGVSGELEVRLGRFAFGAGVLELPSRTFAYAPGTVALSFTAGFARACGTLLGDGGALRFALCVDPLAGVVSGQGQGFASNHSSSQPWAALGLGPMFHQRIVGSLSWGARADLLIPFLKGRFLVDNGGTAFQPAPVGVALDAEIRLSIW